MRKLVLLCIASLSLLNLTAQVSLHQVLNTLKEKGYVVSEKEIVITNQYTEQQSGITHVYFKQRINGTEVFNTQGSLHFNKNNQLFYSNIDLKLNAATPAIATLDAMQAIQVAFSEAKMNNLNQLGKTLNLDENNSFIITNPEVSSEPVKGKFVYYNTGSSIVPAWQVEVLNDESNDWLNVIVDATNSTVIFKNNYTIKCNTDHIYASEKNRGFYFEFTDDHTKQLGKVPGATYNVIAMPGESPKRGGRSLVSNPSTSNASPFGWHDTDGVEGADFTYTRGNNVWAKEDTLSRNGIGYSPNGGSSLNFDFPYDYNNNPRQNLDAAITNLFYMNNVMHDVTYNYGFDEASGNFQSNNYGKGGLGGDGVHADAQDGSGTNNANFSAPADGSRGRMQMYIWGKNLSNQKFLEIKSPVGVAGTYAALYSQFGPKPGPEGITGNLVVANDSSSKPTEACNALKNDSASIWGKIVVIDRGSSTTSPNGCPYTQKVKNAQNAGAIGVILVYNQSFLFGAPSGTDTSIKIPSILVTNTTGTTLKNAITGNTVTGRLYDSSMTKKLFDSDFDNGVIAHEFGHGVSIRLTGGPANSNCLSNQEQAGEGWSDFLALALTSKETETQVAGRGVGTYLIEEDSNGVGIRDYRYSRNMTTNPLRYKDVAVYKAVHGIGAVWCSMLYDLYLNMIDKYGYDKDIYNGNGGNNRTIRLVMLGLKLQKCSPGFVDSRDAILAADSVLYGKANYNMIWQTFARRGLGYNASQGSSASYSDQVENFDLPPGVPATGTEEITPNTLNVFPNPSVGSFTLETSSGSLKDCQIELYNLAGVQIGFDSHFQSNDNVSIRMRSNEKGIYLLKVYAPDGIMTKKLIVN